MSIQKLSAVFGVVLVLAACSTDAPTAGRDTPQPEAAAPAAAPAPAPAGNVIEVKMVTNGAQNYFEPAEVRARPGDVVRFVLVSGVHNVSFPAAQNAGAPNLPAASAFLQSPGQTFDVPVSMGPGSYTFVCDPHAVLGMVGTLTVE